MALESTKDFEERLAQLGRFYRALHDMYANIRPDDQPSIAQWVRLGGKIMERMDEVLSEIEVYSGAADLRIITSELKQMRAAKESVVERT